MRRILFILLLTTIGIEIVNAQTTANQGKVIAEIFTDFHYNLDDTSKTTGFGLNRAYLGYSFFPVNNFFATIIVNIGSPDDLAYGSVPKRYAYFREASVAYRKDKLTINFGMVSTRIFAFQQNFWGKRYVTSEFQALYGYGSVADLGVVLDYSISDVLKLDLSVLNGEGYTNIQIDSSLKAAAGLTITTPKKLAFRLYGDISKPRGVWQSTLIAFAGIKNSIFSFGAEASYKSNLDLNDGHNVWGVSATGSLFLSEKSEIFGRYDYATSILVPGEILPWNYRKDAANFIGGIQYTLSGNLRMALNYRLTDPAEPGIPDTHAIYLNAHFKF